MLLREVSFLQVLSRRIYNVLIIANPYDAFMLEDDGRIEEKIFNEYMQLGLRYPPSFIQVSTTEEAANVLDNNNIDLAICMPGNADNTAFDVARSVKERYPNLPCVVLTPFSHGITRRMQNEDLSIFDYVFCWLGNTNLILSIIKLIEDRMNVEHDIQEAGVQVILLVEDSIRFYSSILPNIYGYILKQSKHFSTEALNHHAATLRMRGRPKVMLARTFNEAVAIFDRYHDNILGVISDARFPISTGGEKVADSGMRLLRYMRSVDEYLTLIMESAESENRAIAEQEGFRFVDKHSKKMSIDLRHMFEEHMGFGDFIFRDPTTHAEVARLRSLKDMQDQIFTIPRESMLYHVSRNHLSRWLSARALFPISEFLKHITWHVLQDVDEHRQIIFDAIVQYRKMKNIGVVADFDRMKFDRFAHFARIGEGSLGGKGRGLAFLDNILKQTRRLEDLQNRCSISIPKTVVLCTEIFDDFMYHNHLYDIALSDAEDQVILDAFLKAKLPESLSDDLNTFIDATHTPLAIRSSSLLEDAHYQPFAGVYSTYMIPYLEDRRLMLKMLADAIKGVYASVFFKDSKAYMVATQNVIDQEKMAVIVQQVVGKQYGERFYPTFSGVLRSINFYPVGDEVAEEGIASLALGLGKYIVDGGQTLRVNPYHPQNVMQLSETETALRETQTVFYALGANTELGLQVDDGFNLTRVKVKEAVADGTLQNIASTFDPYDQVIYDGVYPNGRKIISFAGVLHNDAFTLPEIMSESLKLGAERIKRPVEIELAGNVNNDGSGEVYLLQIRPIVELREQVDVDINSIPEDECLIKTSHSLGHGIVENISDVVYVKTGPDYSPMHNPRIADELESLNRKFTQQLTSAGGSQSAMPYILAGPGRWGSSDYWLGIPVKWPHISNARLICELPMPNRHVDPSQGTHFFQNLTSLGVGYFTIDGDDLFNSEYLDSLPAVSETKYVRHVKLPKPLRVVMNGLTQKGAVYGLAR